MRLLDAIALLPAAPGSFPGSQGWLFNAQPVGLGWGMNPLTPVGVTDELSPPFIVDGVPNPMRCERATVPADICLAVPEMRPVVAGFTPVVKPKPPPGVTVLAVPPVRREEGFRVTVSPPPPHGAAVLARRR